MKKKIQKIFAISALIGMISSYLSPISFIVMAVEANNEALNEVQENIVTSENNELQDEIVSTEYKEIPTKFMNSPEEDTIIEFDQNVKNSILYHYNDIDTNNDGNISIAEINAKNIDWLSINANNQTISLYGLEYFKDLHSLSIYNFSGELNLQFTAELPQLTHFNTSGYITNIKNTNGLSNLNSLEISTWEMNSSINLDFVKGLANLKTLSIGGHASSLEFVLGLTNLEELNLELADEKYDNLSKLEEFKKLRKLKISNRGSMGEIDFNTISKLKVLEELTIDLFENNIEPIKILTNIKSLELTNWNWIELDNSFFNTLNELNIENIELRGRFTANLGILNKDINNEINFNDILILKKLLEKFENKTVIVSNSQDSGVDPSCININNNDKKITITPNAENKRYVDISNNSNDFDIRLKWQLEDDNQIVEFSDQIKSAILQSYNDIDQNNDGNISFTELNSREITWLNINANNQEISLDGIENLLYLESASIFNIRGEINLQKLSTLSNLRSLSASGNISNVINANLLTNLESLSINSWDSNSIIDLEFLKELINLKRLDVGSYVSNISTIYELINLESLTLDINNEKYNDLSKITKLVNLKQLRLNNLDYVDEIDFNSISNLNSLESLSIYVSRMIQPNEEFFNNLKNLNINIILEGNFIANLGDIDNDKDSVFNYKDVPVINNLLNYTNDKSFKLRDWQEEGVNVNCINIDNANERFTINPNEDDKKFVDISTNNNSLSIRLQWTNPGDNEEVVLDEKVKQAILNSNSWVDENHDGILTKAELGANWFTNLNLYLNYQDVNLEGIDKIKNLTTININGVKDNLDYSCLKNLKKLREVYISGNFSNVTTIDELTQITSLELESYLENVEIDYSPLAKLVSLESLGIRGATNLAWIDNLTKLKELKVQSNNKLDCKSLENANNIEKLIISTEEIDNLTSLQKLNSLKELEIRASSFDASELNKLDNLEKLSLIGNFENLNVPSNLKELSLCLSNYESESILNLSGIQTVESLSIQVYGKAKANLSSLSEMTNLKSLLIEADYLVNLDNINVISGIHTLESLTVNIYNDENEINIANLVNKNLVKLSIRGCFDDITPITQLTKLENVTLENKILSKINIENYVNNLEKINVLYHLDILGEYELDLEPIICGKNRNYDLSNLPILSRALNSNSTLYNNDYIDISFYENAGYMSERNKSTVTLNGRIVNITALEFGDQTYNFYISRGNMYNEYNESKVNLDLKVIMKWKNSIEANLTEVEIIDQNLKAYLLEKHDIDGDKKITKNDLVNIETLDISNKNIVNITGLEEATNLVNLNVQNNQIIDLTPICNLKKIANINFNNNRISNIEPLKNLETFEYINLCNNWIEDITSLKKFQANLITKINFGGNYINMEEGGKNKETLEQIEFGDIYDKFNFTTELEASQKYSKVSERNDIITLNNNLKQRLIEIGIDLNNDNNITKGELNDYNQNYEYANGRYEIDLSNLGLENSDIEFLKYLNCVEEINLSNNNLTDVSPMKFIGKLRKINLSNNNIDLNTFKGFRNLMELDLSNNKLQDIKPLGNIGYGSVNRYWYGNRFVKLNLSNNNIIDISPINTINSLLELNLCNNKIKDISVLKNYDFSMNENMYGLTEYFEINLSNNYINVNDNNTKEVVELFKTNNGNIILDNQNEDTGYTIGDVTGDGKINAKDLNRLYAHVNGTKPLDGNDLLAGDVTGDGKINAKDLNRLYAHVNGTKPLGQ